MPTPNLEDFNEDSVALANFAKALSHPARIQILQFLALRAECPCLEIVAALPLSQPACSRHIRELFNAGLLNERRQHATIFYSINHEALNQFCQSMHKTLHPTPSL